MGNTNCYEFWNLAKSLKIAEIVALWCGVEPSQFNQFHQQTGYMPSCADAKKVVLEDALISGELDYIDEGIPMSDGKVWTGGDTQELIQKKRLRIEKSKLKEWFISKYEQGELKEIPLFLDKDKQTIQPTKIQDLEQRLETARETYRNQQSQIDRLTAENYELQKQLNERLEADTPAEPIGDKNPLNDPRTQNNLIRLLLAVNEMAKEKKGNSLDYGRKYNQDNLNLINQKLDLLSFSPLGETAYSTLTTLIREKEKSGKLK